MQRAEDASSRGVIARGRLGARVELRGLERAFGNVKALDGFSLQIEPGELVALLGPSGSGKTTVLRVLAGLEAIDAGSVLLDGDEITALPAYRRDMGMVFQAYSLFPNMTALDNVAFGLKLRRMGRQERSQRAKELLSLAGLAAEANRYPHQLSGGQQQRVALARALAIEPRVLLLDEPLSALDAKVRSQLRDEIRRVQREVGITALFVTHDQEEALSIADRVGVMRSGTLEQVGSPSEIYDGPSTAFVAEFVGSVNRLPGIVAEHGQVSVLGTLMPLREGGSSRAVGSGGPGCTALPVGTRVDVLIRAEAVGVTPIAREEASGVKGNGPTASIASRAFLGPVLRIGVQLHGEPGLEDQVGTRSSETEPGGTTRVANDGEGRAPRDLAARELIAVAPATEAGALSPGTEVRVSFSGSPLFVTVPD